MNAQQPDRLTGWLFVGVFLLMIANVLLLVLQVAQGRAL